MTIPANCPYVIKSSANSTRRRRIGIGCLFYLIELLVVVGLACLFLVMWVRLPW